MGTFNVEWLDRALITRFYGVFSFHDAARATDAWVGDGRFDSIDYYVVDLQAVERMALDEADLKRAAVYSAALPRWVRNRRVRSALVVSRDEDEAKVRKYIALANSAFERRAFRDFDEAVEWARAAAARRRDSGD